MPTTLTREALLSKAKARYREVEVDGIGLIGIRSLTETQRCVRDQSYYHPETGEVKEGVLERMRTDAIIDQVMIDESTPMFTAEDVETIRSLDASVTGKLYDAIKSFNGELKPKKDSSADGSES